MARTRSVQQNKFLWGVVYAEISRVTGRSPEDVHCLMTRWFLPRAPALRKLSNWPDGDVRTVPEPRTSALTTAEFNEFTDRVREFARVLLHLDIPDADYWRFGPPAR